jgi:hypothetical protein
MKIQLEIEVANNNRSFIEAFFNSISFVKKVRTIESNEVTNSIVMESIEQYEKGKVKPTPLNLKDLKEYINALTLFYVQYNGNLRN